MIGNARWRLDDSPRALAAFRDAARFTPNDPNLPNNIACCHIGLGEFKEALEQLRVARTMITADHGLALRILVNLAEAYQGLGEGAAARSALDDAIRIADPKLPRDWLVLAAQSAIVGAEDDAIEFLAQHVSGVAGIELGATVGHRHPEQWSGYLSSFWGEAGGSTSGEGSSAKFRTGPIGKNIGVSPPGRLLSPVCKPNGTREDQSSH